MTAAHESQAQRLLNNAAELQQEFLEGLTALETHLGIKIDRATLLEDETVATLVEGHELEGSDGDEG